MVIWQNLRKVTWQLLILLPILRSIYTPSSFTCLIHAVNHSYFRKSIYQILPLENYCPLEGLTKMQLVTTVVLCLTLEEFLEIRVFSYLLRYKYQVCPDVGRQNPWGYFIVVLDSNSQSPWEWLQSGLLFITDLQFWLICVYFYYFLLPLLTDCSDINRNHFH